jgi:HK97 family phage major capsid protein
MPDNEKSVADLLKENRAEAETVGARIREMLAAAEAESKRALTEDEANEFDKLVARQESLSKQELALQREELRLEDEKRRQEALAAGQRDYGSHARVTSEPSVYTPVSSWNRGPSYFRDLWRAKKGDAAAVERLRKNDAHVAAYSKRDSGLNTGNGAGGEFVPPLWLENEFVPLARPGRVSADLCTKDGLPEGTDSINIPKVATGTAVAVQGYPTGGQNTPIQATDLTTTSISSGVFTAAGGQTVSLQLIEQSPVNIDKVVLTDLALANAINTDGWVLSGGGGSTAPQGILGLTGVNAITVSQTTAGTAPLVGAVNAGGNVNLYTAIAQAISQVQRKRFLPPTHIVMHPTLWYYMLTQADSQSRPVVLANTNGLFNSAGVRDGLDSEGIVGNILGLPVVADPNMPTNLGAGTNQTPIIVGRFSDAWLWEGAVKAEAFEQTYANQLSLYLRLYQYVSFQAGRYAQSFSVINGNGLVAPTNF